MSKPLSANALIDALQLQPLPEEGGFFRVVHRSFHVVPASVLPDGFDTARPLGTAIDFLVTTDSFSALHHLQGEERYVFVLGDPAEQFRLHPDGRTETVLLGHDFEAGQQLHTVVPPNVWQGTRPSPAHKALGYSLFSISVTPGFEQADFAMADVEALRQAHPHAAESIRRFAAPA
ncbi:MAG: cupin domain-containing protein [Opitutales bacterium]